MCYFKRIKFILFAKKTLNKVYKKYFGVKVGYKDTKYMYCYRYCIENNKYGMIQVFTFSAHSSHLFFIFSKDHLEVLQPEIENSSLMNSFESKIKYFEGDFDQNTIEKMRAYIADYYK